MILAMLLGGGLMSCLAALDNARALECCSKDCPRPPAHQPNQCCTVRNSPSDAQVAPAMQLTNADFPAFSVAMLPAFEIFATSAPSRPLVRIAWSPPPRLMRNVLCSLLI